MTTITGIDELKKYEGKDLGASEWHEVTQKDIDAFADVTGDHQWIHVDPERAKDTPFGGTIAHGYYTVSLAPMLGAQILDFEGFAFALNYGLDRVRFPAPLKVGAKVRVTIKLAEVSDIPGGAQVNLEHTFEAEGADKPVCISEALARFYAADPQRIRTAGPASSRNRARYVPGRTTLK